MKIYIIMDSPDKTEGRLASKPHAYTSSHTCAQRLAQGRGVQGAPGMIHAYEAEEGALGYQRFYLAPVGLVEPTSSEVSKDADAAVVERKRERADEAYNRLVDAGVSVEDLQILRDTPA